MHQRPDRSSRAVRATRLDGLVVGAVVLGVGIVVAALLWTVEGGGALAQAVFIGGAAVATVPLSIRAMLRWGAPGAPVGAGLLGALLVPSFVASIAAGITIAIALATPSGQAFATAAQSDGQSWFSGIDATAAQIAITALLPTIGGLGIGVVGVVLVGLPWLAIRRPAIAAAGSTVEQTGTEHSPLIVRLIFLGLAPLLVGIGLWVAADEPLARFPDALAATLRALARGIVPSWYDLGFVLGVVLVAIGAASMVAGIVLMARRRPSDGR